MENALKQKVDENLESFIGKMKPENGRLFTYSELMLYYKKLLHEFSQLAYQEINKAFIDEQLRELKQNINPTVRASTDGTDEIIGAIAVIETTKIILEHGVEDDKYGRKENRPELDDANEAIFRSMRYLYTNSGGPAKKIHDRLGKYIYRNNNKATVGQSSGCVVTILIFSGFISTIFGFFLF
tara:strand:- start:675 stop:1223 length:549 start_codon:yes stop_codon:yes gene_type:complete